MIFLLVSRMNSMSKRKKEYRHGNRCDGWIGWILWWCEKLIWRLMPNNKKLWCDRDKKNYGDWYRQNHCYWQNPYMMDVGSLETDVGSVLLDCTIFSCLHVIYLVFWRGWGVVWFFGSGRSRRASKLAPRALTTFVIYVLSSFQFCSTECVNQIWQCKMISCKLPWTQNPRRLIWRASHRCLAVRWSNNWI